jgi:hypothetical protein
MPYAVCPMSYAVCPNIESPFIDVENNTISSKTA